MVIWLFAGGGEAELGDREAGIRGIVSFFEKHFPDFIFERITPVRNKRLPDRVKSNSSASMHALGKTGNDLAKQIKSKLEDKVKQGDPFCNAILILDDLDCDCPITRKKLFEDTIDQVADGKFKDIKRIIGFAAPELESWLIADWHNTIAKHMDFGKNHLAMKRWLKNNGVSFETPEKFSEYDPGKKSCKDKLSEYLIESSKQHIDQVIYKKAKHTPLMLYDSLKPEVVVDKCPLFKAFYLQLKNLRPCVDD